MKYCNTCGEEKELDQFYNDKSKKDGKTSNCRKCKNKSNAKYRKTEKGKAAEAKYKKSEKRKAALAKYFKSDKGKAAKKATNHNRRARIKGNGGTLTSQEIKMLQDTPNKSCFWCEADCNDNYDLDHIVPLAKGGRNSRCNIAISCPSCNRSKGDKDLSEWLEEIKWFKIRREENDQPK